MSDGEQDTHTSVTDSDLQQLTHWDTPTICNGLELVCPERRATGFTTRPLVALDPNLPPVIGYARTARIRAMAPPITSAAQTKAVRLAYYEYIAAGPRPSIVVIEDLDSAAGFGAFWGEVNTHVHRGLGAAGCVTNGSMRDIPDSARGFQLLADRVGPSHAHVHVVDFGGSVTVHNMTVQDGDIVHMDQHGAVVVPLHAVAKLPAAIELIARREAKLISASKLPDFSIEQLRKAMADAEDIH